MTSVAPQCPVMTSLPPNNPGVIMWTLGDPDAAMPWVQEYEASFVEIWPHSSYLDTSLPPHKAPNITLLDHDNHSMTYFFQGPMLFGLDVRRGEVVACDRCLINNDAL